MAGVTNSGFVTKRLADILADDRALAVQLFQDLVQPNDIVDTSDSSALGRLISLAAPSEADLWEAAQEVYAAFDPNSATGIALDNLVAYAGLTRKEQTFTTSSILVAGDTNVLIPVGQTVSSSTTGEQFTTTGAISLAASNASGITVSVVTLQNSTAYTITYANTTTSNTITFTSDASATVAEILAGLQSVIAGAHPTLTASVVGTTLVIDRNDIFQTVNFTTSVNLGINKVRAVGEVVAVDSGIVVQPANTIDTILTPMLGWDSVINPVPATPGEDRETDEQLRLRFRNGKFDRATNTLDAIYSALINLDNVSEVTIYENDTSAVDGNGVPAHSFLPIVVGGLSTDIANAIWDNKPIGILSYGNTTVSINDVQGFPHNVSFSRPTPVVIYISVDITTDVNFPANGNDAIKSAIIQYFADNLGTGDDVIYSRLYTPINSINGHEVVSLKIGTSPSPVGTTNIIIPFDSIASISATNIVIT
jgi:Uncharacterized homolog of phage Mu protein gp47